MSGALLLPNLARLRAAKFRDPSPAQVDAIQRYVTSLGISLVVCLLRFTHHFYRTKTNALRFGHPFSLFPPLSLSSYFCYNMLAGAFDTD